MTDARGALRKTGFQEQGKLPGTNRTLLPAMKKSGKAHFEEHGCPDTRAFAALLLKRFETLEEAYRHFDGNKNYQLGMTEFVSGARALHFTGNARAVFKELDKNNNGNISIEEFKAFRLLKASEEEAVTSKTRRDEVLERKQRSPIQPPSRHMRSTCLASSHIRFPEAEHISSSAGFFSFKREGTGRSDLLLHPDQLPGCDGENFSKEHGPGYCQKGPEHFAEVMTDMHPLRGNKFKIGSMVTRTERFGPAIPSVEGKKDLDHSASNFATYKGQMPQTNWRTDGTGAQVLLSKRARMCLTTGFTDSFSVGLVKPVPFGPWGESRMTLRLSRLKSQSETSLKYKDKRD
ncbi:unnamed protein product [Durusdinium trenchii]|uniref:EF-hand domain-containing protein n=1 Tax=Durusdinium trenchii TaxID=1381693 RepID=A0ABP0P311_9DINO